MGKSVIKAARRCDTRLVTWAALHSTAVRRRRRMFYDGWMDVRERGEGGGGGRRTSQGALS